MQFTDEDVIGGIVAKCFKINPLNVCTKDGSCLEIDARMIIQLDDASFIIARFGSIPDLVKERVEPLINNLLSHKERAIDLLSNRLKLQEDLTDAIQIELTKYHVKIQSFTIVYMQKKICNL
jgi:hypothetical protein